MLPQKRLMAAIVCSILVACDPNASNPNQTSATFGGGKQLIVVAEYTLNAQSNSIEAWADVPIGTAANLEMTGPLHMHCNGTFQTPRVGFMSPYGSRPELYLEAFAAPPGRYTVVVSIPSLSVELKTTFVAGSSYEDPITNVWDLPRGCVQVADTAQQLLELTTARTDAVQIWVNRVEAPDLRSRLVPLATAAVRAVERGDKQAAIEALTAIQLAVEPLTLQGRYLEISRDANAALALLAQPVPTQA